VKDPWIEALAEWGAEPGALPPEWAALKRDFEALWRRMGAYRARAPELTAMAASVRTVW
jgi:hypothetical protein